MDNKLSELSKPVATVDVQRGRPDGNMFCVAWSSAGHALPDGPHFIYSQEYVSALLAELEAKDDALRAIAFHVSAGGYNADSVDAEVFKQKIIDGINGISDVLVKRIAELEAKLATPVRLPLLYSPDPWMSPDPDGTWLDKEDVKKSIRTAGFTVEGA